MIHTHSLGRAARFYPTRTALASAGTRRSFRELHDRVAGIAAALAGHGFQAGDRLALLLPNEPDYIELVYACGWLGVIAVPLNTRLAPPELDRILTDATPRGLIRHSSLPAPTVRVPLELVLDNDWLRATGRALPRARLRPGLGPGPDLHERHNRASEGRRADPRERPRKRPLPQLLGALQRRRCFPPRGADVPHRGLPAPVRGAGFRHLPGHDPKVQSAALLRGSRARPRHPHGAGADDDQHADPVPGPDEVRHGDAGASRVRRISHASRTYQPHQGGSPSRETGSGVRAQRDGLPDRPA